MATAGPAFPRGTGEAKDQVFTDREWTNGRKGDTYQHNTKGPWQLRNRRVIAQWGARADPPGPQHYYLRPSLLNVRASWGPYGARTAAAATRFHLRQTKYIDHITDAIVIQTDATKQLNRASRKENEWLSKASGYGAAQNGAARIWVTTIPAIPDLEAIHIPSFNNAELNRMHILVNGTQLDTMAGADPTRVYPANVVTLVEIQNYHLRLCYYAALDQGVTPTPFTAGTTTAIMMAIAAAVAGGPAVLAQPPAIDITFPLMGYKTFGKQRAAEQACIALREWFSPTIGSESHAIVAGLGAGAAMTALMTTRRAHYDAIFLTLPNGYPQASNARLPDGGTVNVYRKEMGEQELAWHKAFFSILCCPTCDRGPLGG